MGIKPKLVQKYYSRHFSLQAYLLILEGTPLKQALVQTGFELTTPESKPFILYLVSETIRYQRVFDHVIAKFLEKKPQKKYEAFFQAILSLGCCELLRSKQSPHIILSAYTEITKCDKKTNHLSGTIRAILGNIHTHIDEFQQIFTDYNLVFGQSLYNDLNTDYPDNIQDIASALLSPAPTDILKLVTSCETPKGYHELSPWSARCQEGILPQNLAVFKDGEITIQSFASSCVFMCLPQEIAQKNVLDLCAAPGGKTLHALSIGAKVTALDISSKRIDTLKENLKRSNLTADLVVADILDYTPSQQYDCVLLDAPCSATGTIRKNPDLIYHYDKTQIDELKKLQHNMLNKASKLMTDHGILIYSVCTLNKQEAEDQVLNFIKQNPEFKIQIPAHQNYLPVGSVDQHNFIRILPYFEQEHQGHEGFFIAYLSKVVHSIK